MTPYGRRTTLTTTSSSPSTALSVTWFGGTAETEAHNDGGHGEDSCELVAVRIERTGANSRRIRGDITVPGVSVDGVWDVLTDYDRLAVHVPNLVESRVVAVQTPRQRPGDGKFRCRLFQKGAQKIVGFEFGASVTMDMTERIVRHHHHDNDNSVRNVDADDDDRDNTPVDDEERVIEFRCHDSFFFQTFDGRWKAVQRRVDDGNVETVLSYSVDVRPKGPVPVAALEWRIREDVPTNLRAVKTAALRSSRQQRQPRQQPDEGLPRLRRDALSTGDTLHAYDDDGKYHDSSNNNNDKTPKATTTTTTTLRAPRETVPLRFPTRDDSGGDTGRYRRIDTDNDVNNNDGLTPRQRQEAAAARRALRAPRISEYARAAAPPPRNDDGKKSSSSSPQRRRRRSQSQQQPQQQRRMKVRVDWDDNETLGAYLKRP